MLNDVVLTGRVLISDDPKMWVVPKSLKGHADVLAWWDELREVDDATHVSGFTAETKALLLWLAGEYQFLMSEGLATAPHQAKLRSVVRHICQLGMETSQAAILLDVTQDKVVRTLYCNVELTQSGLEARLEAEQMLRAKVPAPMICAHTGLEEWHVSTLAEMLGLERVFTSILPIELRDAAIKMRHNGMTNPEISEFFLKGHGAVIASATISQWWRRYGSDINPDKRGAA